MPDANGIMDSMSDASLDDSQQDTQLNDNTSGNDTENSQNQEQQFNNDPALLDKINRLNGQISTLQKKYIEATRQGRVNPDSAGDTGSQETDSLKRGLRYAKFEIVDRLESNIFSLYNGKNPQFEGEPSLDDSELAEFKKHLWSYISEDSMVNALQGNYDPALIEIEQAIADKAQAKASENSNSNVNQMRVQHVNPMPAPTEKPSQEEEEDLWTMPMDQLEKRADVSRRQRMNG